MDFKNWRINPFTNVKNVISITNEAHTISYREETDSYGFWLNEAVQLDNPSSVSIITDVTGGPTYTEVPRSQTPLVNQFRVDYDADTFLRTSFIEFHADNDGEDVLVSYNGLGTNVLTNYRDSQSLIQPVNIDITENLLVEKKVEIDQSLKFGASGQEISVFDTDGTGAANSDSRVMTQKAAITKMGSLDTAAIAAEVSARNAAILAAVPTGTVLPYAGILHTPPTGFFLCIANQNASKTTYANLWAILSENMGSISFNISSDVATLSSPPHTYFNGMRIFFTSSGTLPTGLTAHTNYFISQYGDFGAGTFKIATTYANAIANVTIDLTGSAGSGHNATFAPFGTSSSTNFIIPDYSGVTMRGASEITGYSDFVFNPQILLGRRVDDAMQGHLHDSKWWETVNESAGFGLTAVAPFQDRVAVQKTGGNNTGSPVSDGSNGTPRIDSETRMKYAGINFIIKY